MAELGSAVVVAEDPAMAPAVQRVPVGAVLTHTDPVAVTAPADDERACRHCATCPGGEYRARGQHGSSDPARECAPTGRREGSEHPCCPRQRAASAFARP